MAEHVLKTWIEPFTSVVNGLKRAEFRRNDRDFREADMLFLREWDHERECYTGRWARCIVTDIRHPGPFGIPDGFAMMSIVKHEWGCDAAATPRPEPCP